MDRPYRTFFIIGSKPIPHHQCVEADFPLRLPRCFFGLALMRRKRLPSPPPPGPPLPAPLAGSVRRPPRWRRTCPPSASTGSGAWASPRSSSAIGPSIRVGYVWEMLGAPGYSTHRTETSCFFPWLVWVVTRLTNLLTSHTQYPGPS